MVEKRNSSVRQAYSEQGNGLFKSARVTMPLADLQKAYFPVLAQLQAFCGLGLLELLLCRQELPGGGLRRLCRS